MLLQSSVASTIDVSNEQIKKIKEKIGEDEARITHYEDLLQQWAQSESHLPENYDKIMARNLIRGSKFNLETAKNKLEAYFMAKDAFPKLYHDRNPTSNEITTAFKTVNIVRMPKLTSKGERIAVFSLNDPDSANFDIRAIVKMFFMLQDVALTCDLPTTGEVQICDCKDLTPEHLMKLVSTPVKNCFAILRNIYAIRIGQIHFVNYNPGLEILIKILRPLLHEKVRNRIVFHRNVESLDEHIPLDLLPQEFGGKLESLRHYMKIWQDVLVANCEWFQEQEKVKLSGVPPKKIEHYWNQHGVEGSFRQLNID